MKTKLPHLLFAAYIVYFIVLGIHPFDRAVWYAENIPIFAIAIFLALTYRWFKFSNFSYIMMSVLLFLHTLGGHYTFERVPFDFVTRFFDFSRNNFDRLGHFSVGLYAYPIAEFLERKKLTSSRTMMVLFAIACIFATAAVYEIIEWLYAVNADPSAGIAFLGSQGDIWDAQKDMLLDGSGSLLAAALFLLIRRPVKITN